MKNVLIHIGPHKTGSTAIQKCFSSNTEALAAHGVSFYHDSLTHHAAISLANERYELANLHLDKMAFEISQLPHENVILSQEDFSGDLLGRSRKRQIYPKLTKNLRIIRRALSDHNVTFVFFVRDENEWLKSCYVQSLRFRTQFYNFDSFQERYGNSFTWEQRLTKPQETFDTELVLKPYCRDVDAGVNALLELIGLDRSVVLPIASVSNVNSSPSTEQIELLEHINRVSEFPPTAWFSKKLIMEGWLPREPSGEETTHSWPPKTIIPKNCALPKLSERAALRVPSQKVSNILPKKDIDLWQLANTFLPKEMESPNISRADIGDQSQILEYHFRGKTQLAHLTALSISYLRRDTKYTEQARFIFHKIWENCGPILVNELSTRWLISTLQTFIDHGKNESQRQIGTAGYFYANMMKIYEGERSIEGHAQDADYSEGTPQTKNQFRGLDRFNVGGTDLLLNTNALLLEIALKDEVAGLVLQEFLLRTKSANTVFSRFDRARQRQDRNIEGFLDTWSFFEEPKYKNP